MPDTVFVEEFEAGTLAAWPDGVDRRGTWSGFSFRSVGMLRLNAVQLSFNRGSSGGPATQKLFVDHLVVTTARPRS